MTISEGDVTPEGDDILDMYGSPTCSTPPPVEEAVEPQLASTPKQSVPTNSDSADMGTCTTPLASARLRPPRTFSRTSQLGKADLSNGAVGSGQFDTSLTGASPGGTGESKNRQLREIQKRLSSFASLASADVSLASSRMQSPNASFQGSQFSGQQPSSPSVAASNFSFSSSLSRQTAAESQLLSIIGDARSTLQNDMLVALLERVVADTVSLYTRVGDDAASKVAVDRVSMSLADFISRYVAQAAKK